MKNIILMFSILFLLGCKKIHSVPENIAYIEGDYEWSNSGSINESEDNYGITIDKKGYLYTFKNSKQIKRYKIKGYYPYSTLDGGNSISIETYEYGKMGISGTITIPASNNLPIVIRLSRFPFNEENFFYHHE